MIGRKQIRDRAVTVTEPKRRYSASRSCLMGRWQRKGLGYSKSFEIHQLAVALHFGVYNFVRKQHTLGITPAVAGGLGGKGVELRTGRRNDPSLFSE